MQHLLLLFVAVVLQNMFSSNICLIVAIDVAYYTTDCESQCIFTILKWLNSFIFVKELCRFELWSVTVYMNIILIYFSFFFITHDVILLTGKTIMHFSLTIT